MSHYLKRNITFIGGKGDDWSPEDMAPDIVTVYKGENMYSPMDVGTYQFLKITLEKLRKFKSVDFFNWTWNFSKKN